MSAISQSYISVFYDLRPAKQVERRMLIELLIRLQTLGYQIKKYKYIGMGSIYYVDFIMFHKYLGIERMLSVEIDQSIPKRIEFNRPYGFIETKIAPIGDVIGELDREDKYLLWLDYDSIINKSIADDIYDACHTLSPGSLLIITVDAQSPEGETLEERRKYYEQEVEDFLGVALDDQFASSKVVDLNKDIIRRIIKHSLSSSNKIFNPLISFNYKDGHRMFSYGGIITYNGEESKLQESIIKDLEFIRMKWDDSPYEINVPRITRKERLYLDSCMPCEDGWCPKDFELDKVIVDNYRKLYRFMPFYSELYY